MKFTYSLIKKIDYVSSDSVFSGEIDKRDILKISAPDGTYTLVRADQPNYTISENFSDEIHEYLQSLPAIKWPSPSEHGCENPSPMAVEYAIHHLITGETEFESFSPGQSSELVLIFDQFFRVSGINNMIRVEAVIF